MNGYLEKLSLQAPYFLRLIGVNLISWNMDRARRGKNWEKYMKENDFKRYHEGSQG